MREINKNGVRYIEMKIACPVCRERGVTTPITNWVHASNNCGGLIYLGDNGYTYCERCSNNTSIRQARWKCPTHSTSDDEYIGVNNIAVYHEIIACAGMMVNAAGKEWLMKCIQSI